MKTEMARARASDPRTSHEAAKSVSNITGTQQAILGLLRTPLCDSELLVAYRLGIEIGAMPFSSESGIRSRRAELVEKGLVVATGEYRLSTAGRRMIVWVAS
jgi:hypothetical protein